ncbi:LPS export ABC transporter permease LptG [Cognatishimia activa]|uniref:Lipopolysaccharide ABC transporter permease n=1 Tax=Cognatishimia activa TaxID=1715691 RepID=A0A0P1IUD8_9RHOB|nr:LPS export ABC transporter permease LptG [Cognatishimia activa]CUJ31875.1 lipopolysaccharide ABC transporter permease [Cognatishimia activa]CUK27166.1 lipopolysaccharide ABC transporter permease [Cognatishimia activa]
MTLYFYFARKFLWAFLALTGVFAAILLLFDLVEHLRRFDTSTVGYVAIFELMLLNMPKELYQIIPLIMILSSLVLFLNLARSSELVVTRASGRSALISLLSPVTVALFIGLFGVTTLNPIVAATTKRYDDQAAAIRSGGGNVLTFSRDGIWLRQGGDTGQTVIFAEGANHDATSLRGAIFVTFGDGTGPVRRIHADTAQLTDGEWRLTNAKIWPLAMGINSEAESEVAAELALPTSLTAEQIRDGFGKPRTVSVWELPRLINQLEDAGFSARRHTMWLHMELAQPIFLIAMVLVSAAFTMRHTRMGRTGLASLLATMSGFGLYYVRNFAQILGENGQIPIELAAWTPPIASVFLALGLLLHMEDG